MFLSAVFSRFFLILHPGGRLGGKDGSACEEFEDSEGGGWYIGLMFLRVLVSAHSD